MAVGEDVGTVDAPWRFPVKSMRGEQLNSVEMTERGVLGDRAYGLIDKDTGRVASAKSVKLFPNVLDCKAAFVEKPATDGNIPPDAPCETVPIPVFLKTQPHKSTICWKYH